jgi:hypothetical protein
VESISVTETLVFFKSIKNFLSGNILENRKESCLKTRSEGGWREEGRGQEELRRREGEGREGWQEGRGRKRGYLVAQPGGQRGRRGRRQAGGEKGRHNRRNLFQD